MAGTAAGRAEGAAIGAQTRVVLDTVALDRLLRSPEGVVGVFLAKKAVQVEREAKHLCPVDTGRLRASITHGLDRDEQGLVAYVGSNVKYAVFVELGTRHMGAKPYLRPALRSKA